MTYSSEVLADSPVVFYKHAEPSGTTVTDSSGNAHTGTYTGSPALGAADITGDGATSVTFNGTAGQRAQSNATVLAAGTYNGFTLELLSTVPDAAVATFVALVDPTGGDAYSIVQFAYSAGSAIGDYYAAAHAFVQAIGDLALEGRMHLVFRLLDGFASLWVNGIKVNEQPGADMVLGAAASFYAGNSGGSNAANCTIAKSAFYSTGLTDDRILAHAEAAELYTPPVVVAPDFTASPVVRLVTARALVVPHQVQRWMLPIICKERVTVGANDDVEASQDVAAIRDFFLSLRRSGTPVLYQEGDSRHMVIVRDVAFPEGQVERWGVGRNGVQGILIVTIDSCEA